MAFTRVELYNDVCDFLKEGRVAPGAHPLARKIEGKEKSAAEVVLAMHPWNFAELCARLQVAREADDTADEPDATLQGFRYAYNQGDIARVKWVSNTGRERDRLVSGRSWTQTSGGLILSDYSPLYLCAVMNEYALVAKQGYWPRLFGKAVASHIADELSPAVTNSRAHTVDVSARTQALAEEAFLWDAQQSPAPTRREGRWLRSRGRGFLRPGDRL